MTGFTEEQFTGFKRKHYRIASGPAFDACQKYRQARERVSDVHLAYAKSVGGVGNYQGSTARVGNGTPISAVIFEGDLPAGWKPRKWRSFQGLPNGRSAAWPDKRTVAGKAALAEIMALEYRPDPDDICGDIGFPLSLSYSKEGSTGTESLGFFETANVGWIKDVYYLSLPDYAAVRAKREAEGYTVDTPYWSPLEGMDPVLKEEVDLDFARAAVERKRAA